MTATDELRRLLDERGVEWTGCDNQTFCGEHSFTEFKDGMVVTHLTPAQAVEATLGSDLQAENAELRELAKEACKLAHAFYYCGGTFNDLDDLLCEASELGIGVDE